MKTTIEQAEAAFNEALIKAKTVGSFAKDNDNDTAVLMVGSIDKGKHNSLGIAFAGNVVNVAQALISAMKKSPEVSRAVFMAASFVSMGGEDCDCEACVESRKKNN